MIERLLGWLLGAWKNPEPDLLFLWSAEPGPLRALHVASKGPGYVPTCMHAWSPDTFHIQQVARAPEQTSWGFNSSVAAAVAAALTALAMADPWRNFDEPPLPHTSTTASRYALHFGKDAACADKHSRQSSALPPPRPRAVVPAVAFGVGCGTTPWQGLADDQKLIASSGAWEKVEGGWEREAESGNCHESWLHSLAQLAE